jgi:DHA1 family tetracycline resistance protein-like MFS transporter
MATDIRGSSPASSSDRLDFRRILPVFVIVIIDLLGLTIIIPLMPLYAASFGASAFLIGLLGATYPVMQFIGAPFLGRLSDRFGRRPILIVSQIGTLTGFLILGFANGLWLLFLARAVDGISGANISTAQAVISDVTTAKNRTQGLGLLGAAFGLGFIIGPVIAFASLALSGNNYHVPALVAAGFSLASVLLTYFLLDETLPAEQRGKVSGKAGVTLGAMLRALRMPQVGILMALMFAQQIAFGGFQQLLSLFTLNRLGLDASGNAVIFVYVGVIVVAVQGGFLGRWSRRFGERRLIYLGLGLLALGLTMTALTPTQPVPWYSRQAVQSELTAGRSLPGETPPTQSLPVGLPSDASRGWLGLAFILLAMSPVAIGGGVLQPSINSLITKRSDPSQVGGMLGVSAAFLSGANAVAPVVGGAILQALGSRAPFLFGGALLAVLFLIALRAIRPEAEGFPPPILGQAAVAE